MLGYVLYRGIHVQLLMIFHVVKVILAAAGEREQPMPVISVEALKTREWKTRHQRAGVEKMGVGKYGKPKVPVI